LYDASLRRRVSIGAKFRYARAAGDADLVHAFSLLILSNWQSGASAAHSRRNLEASLGKETNPIPHHERIANPEFRRAVDLIDAGDVDGLAQLLKQNPGLVRQRVSFEGDGYFQNPSLLEFIAENPVRRGTLPLNIVNVARTILRADPEPRAIDDTLALVASGRVARAHNVQTPLIELLFASGTDPNSALQAAALHGEFAAVNELIRLGAKPSLPILVAMGKQNEVLSALPSSTPEERHLALAFAAQYGHAEIARALLDAGEDPNRFNPDGAHSHSTPLHQAAMAGHLNVVKLLVERGAKIDALDRLWKGTPLDWALHCKQLEVEKYLRELEKNSASNQRA
jgi:Ankyrin repeats (3 copies)